jgi:hypothetical protein
MEDLYYLQDSRGYVGNDVLWWAKNGHGYTTDLSKAHVYTREEVIKKHESRYSDIPWPKEYIDNKTRPAVDMQYIRRDEAYKLSGIVIKKEKPESKQRYKCEQCHSFLSAIQYYTQSCKRCGTENRP